VQQPRADDFCAVGGGACDDDRCAAAKLPKAVASVRQRRISPRRPAHEGRGVVAGQRRAIAARRPLARVARLDPEAVARISSRRIRGPTASRALAADVVRAGRADPAGSRGDARVRAARRRLRP